MSVATNLLPANTSGIETNTSGWAAGANTTLAQSSRFYAGAHSLQMTATAAGTVSATTSARVAVTPGEIMAYAYFANVAAAIGRSTSVTIAFYATVTGGTAVSTVTSATSLLPNATTWQTPPPATLTTVPAGALYAQLTVTVTGLSIGAQVLMDEAAIGPPSTISGNLLSYGTQGAELDTSGWQNILASTVSRTSTTSYEGWWAVTQTATATGTVRVGTVAAVPVTPGVEYFAYAWTAAPASGGSLNVTLRWYDGTGAQIGSSSQPWTIPDGTWSRRAVSDKAPAGAVSTRLVLEPTATTIGEVWKYDQAAVMVAPVLPGNLLGYAAQSAETTISGWSAVAGCTISRVTTRAWEGVRSIGVTASGGDATVQLVSAVPVTPRQGYKIVPFVYEAGPTATVVDLIFTWLNASGALLSTSSVRWTLGTTAGWYAPIGSGLAPSGATSATVSIRFVGAPAGAVYNIDNTLVAVGGLGVISDPIPGLYGARVSVQGLTTGGYTTWGLWRMLPDGTTTPVRGSAGDMTAVTITGDVAVIEDYESPLGVPVQYLVKLWTPSGSGYLSASSTQIVIPEPPDTQVIIKDPGLPVRWTPAIVEAMPDWQRQARQGVNQVRGRTRPIVRSDVRASRTGTLTLVTETAEERDQIWWLLDTGNTLLIQWPSGWHESDVYVQAGDATETHVTPLAQYSDREWPIALTEVDRPIGGITGSASRTWQNVNDDNSDWLAVLNGADTWLDVLTGVRGG